MSLESWIGTLVAVALVADYLHRRKLDEAWVGVVVLAALALDYMRGRKLDDLSVQQIWQLRTELAEQTRRVDKLFEDARTLEGRVGKVEQGDA